MNLPKVIPQPDSYYLNDHHNSYSVMTTPYSNFTWQETVLAYQVAIPEKFLNIVTHFDGKSTCPHCGAVYVGKQGRCTNMVDYYDDAEHGRKWINSHKGYKPFGSNTGSSYSSKFVVKNYKNKCDTDCKWDLGQEFYEQQRFYGFLSTLPVDPNANFAVFAGVFKDPKQVEIIYLRNCVSNLQMEVTRCMDALQQIAQKMNSAGHALSF